MKKITRIFSAALAVASMAACSQKFDETDSNLVLGGNEFAAEAEASTKVTIDANWKLSWEAGDQVDIFDGESTNVFSAKTAGESTTLAADDKDFTKESGKTYYAVYPSGDNVFTGSEVTLTVAGDRKAEAGVYPSAPAVGVTTGSESTFAFKNVCGLVSFEIAADQNITSVVVFGANKEYVAGSVKVNAETAEYQLVEGTGVKEILLTPADGDVFAAGRYYVAVLPQEFTAGLSVTLYKNDGTRLRKNLKAFTLGRSTHIDVETGGTFKTQYTIKNADELAAFMAVADKCAASTVATLANDIDLSGVTLPAVSSFAGTFDGAGKKLMNWTTDKPLFTKIVAGATVTGVVLDVSCTLKMKETTSRQAFVVGENEGTVSGCTNKANITYTRATDTPMLSRVFGTIVGFSKGLVENCHNEGNITITIPKLDYTLTDELKKPNQRVGGVVGGFSVSAGSVGVTECTNIGDITYTFNGAPQNDITPHFAIGGVCAVVAEDASPKISTLADNNGVITDCTNSGEIKLYQEQVSGRNYSNVGGVVGYLEGTISSCENEAAGKVTLQLKNSSSVKVSAPAIGGVVGNALAGNVSDCSNAAEVYMTGYIQGGTNNVEYAGGTEYPVIGGVAGKVGATTEKTSLKITDCTNSGLVHAKVWNSNNLRMGGVVGWTSIPVEGSAANELKNSGNVATDESTTFKTAYVGGVIGQSISTFNKIYNTGNVTVINASGTAGQKAYVGGVAGYMSKAADSTFKQGNNTGTINVSGGKSDGEEDYVVGGIVGLSATTKVTSNGTSWAECHSNYGDILVNSSVKLCVGGVLGRIGAFNSGTGDTARCKNRGNITVENPKTGSCIGGVVGQHGRGKLGDANYLGDAADPAVITVTGADSGTYVGGYVGQIRTNNGPSYPSCCTTISGFGMYGEVNASGATAAVIAGNVTMVGNTTTNGIMIGTDNSYNRVRLAKTVELNEVVVGDLTVNKDMSTFIATISPSTTTTRTKPDGTSLAGKYYFCAKNVTSEESVFPHGFANFE